MELPKSNEDYREKEYWDNRYVTEECYDWFSDYRAFRHLIIDDIKDNDTILHLGCGNSSLSESMYKDGYRYITNMDYSSIVIDKMNSKYKDICPEMKWDVMDVFDMSYGPESFDIVLEKGTLDALMVHEKDPWNVSEETEQNITTILDQVSRILKNGGKFISVSFAQPHFRRPLYAKQRFNWSYCQKEYGVSFHFFYYVMVKDEQLDDKQKLEEVKRLQKKLNKPTEVAPIYYMEEDTDDYLSFIDHDIFR